MLLKMKKILFSALMLSLSVAAWAQTDDEAIKQTLNNYLEGGATGDLARVQSAFYPTANLRSIANGRVTDTGLKEFLARMPQGGAQWTPKIISYNYLGTAGSAVVEMTMDTFKFVDFLSLVKVGNDWKIVSRVFSRGEPTQKVATVAGTKAATPTKKTTRTAPKSDDGW